MEKSKHIYRNSKIPYEELTNFIEPIEMTLPIYIGSLRNLVNPYTDDTAKIRSYVEKRYLDLYSKFPFLKSSFKSMNERRLKALRPISYTPHLEGYDFRFHPVDITNSLFYSLGYDKKIPFINLDDAVGTRYLKDYAFNYYEDILRKEPDPLKRTIVSELEDKYDKICEEYKEPADIKPFILPKNTLFFLAYSSLDQYERTGDTRYLVLAKEYYDHVSKMDTSDFPHMINRQKTGSKVWYGDFRSEFEEKVPADTDFSTDKIKLRKNGVLLAFEILKPGEKEIVIADTIKRTRAASNVDYEKYQKLFEQKLDFYLKKPNMTTIMGKYGLNGYMGFAYDNEYLVFDKFYNTDYEDIRKRTILTHGEAIYALPSDRFDLIANSTKQEIIEAKKDDTRIKKLNHTETFIPRVEKIIDGPNVSTSTLEKEIEKTKVLVLKK